jgi:hypothetical protein
LNTVLYNTLSRGVLSARRELYVIFLIDFYLQTIWQEVVSEVGSLSFVAHFARSSNSMGDPSPIR